MTATIKSFEKKAKEIEKTIDKSDCLATAQPFIREKEKIEGIIRTAKGLDKAVKDAQHNLEALTNSVNDLIEKSQAELDEAKAFAANAKEELKTKTDKIEIAEAKTKIAIANETLVKAQEALKKVKAEKIEKVANYKLEVNTAKAALKIFLTEHESELKN